MNFAPVYGMSAMSRGPMDRWAYRAILVLASLNDELNLAASREKIHYNLVAWETNLLPCQKTIFQAALDEFNTMDFWSMNPSQRRTVLIEFREAIRRCRGTEEKYELFLSALQVHRKLSSEYLDRYKWFQFKMESIFGPPPHFEMIQLQYETSIVRQCLFNHISLRDEFMLVHYYRQLLVDVEGGRDSPDPELRRLVSTIFKLFSTAEEVMSKIPVNVYFSEKDERYAPTMELLRGIKKELFSLVDRSNSAVREFIVYLEREWEAQKTEKDQMRY